MDLGDEEDICPESQTSQFQHMDVSEAAWIQEESSRMQQQGCVICHLPMSEAPYCFIKTLSVRVPNGLVCEVVQTCGHTVHARCFRQHEVACFACQKQQ